MSKSLITKREQTIINQIVNLVKSASRDITRAAVLYTQLKSPAALEEIRRRIKDSKLIQDLYDIGKGKVLAELLLESSFGAQKLRTMPMSMQKKYSSVPLTICEVRENNDGIIVRKKRKEMYYNLLRDECRVIFGKGFIRSEDEQNAHLLGQLARSNAADYKSPLEHAVNIVKGAIHILKDVTLTKKHLREIIQIVFSKAELLRIAKTMK